MIFWISSAGCIIDLAVEKNIIDKKGSWFNYQDRKLGQGREAVREELKRNKELFQELERRIYESVQASSSQALASACLDQEAREVAEAAK